LATPVREVTRNRIAWADGGPAAAGTLGPEERLPLEQFMNGSVRGSAMTSKNAERRQSDGEINPKIDPAPNSNTEKAPDDWVSGGDPMTGAQASYLKTLSEEVGGPDDFEPGLSKAEASKRIDALKLKRSSARQR
jgi:hypothetical protein